MRAVFKVGGIGVYIHWTFWLLVALYLFGATRQAGLIQGVYEVAFVLSVFACVLLHEFGHSAAAAYYKIRTLDITLFPFGGVARLENLPQKPAQELVIAIAGPAVNVVIAIVVGLCLLLTSMGFRPESVDQVGRTVAFGSGFLDRLLIVNLVLVLFNMLPAFPMDGGRVLRSLLAMRTGHLRATEIATQVGRWMALGFSIMAIVNGPLSLLIIAGFVYVAGTAELMQVRLRSVAEFGSGNPASPLHRYAGARQFYGHYQPSSFNEDQANPNSDSRQTPYIVDSIDVRTIRD